MNETTTILVPGFSDDERCLRGLARYLARNGYEVLTLSPQPSDGRAGIDELAAMLAQQIGRAVPAAQRLNLVGFSMGGLICRYYLQQIAEWQRVEQVITIATPHQGTWSAYLFDRPACHQMRPGSRFLQMLNQNLTVYQTVGFASLWTPFDLTIVPAISSWMPVGEMVTITSPFHRTMVLDPRVLHATSVRLMRSRATSP